MPKKQPLSNEDFLQRVRDYLPMYAAVWNLDAKGKPCSCALSSGMGENQFYRFDSEAVLCASHAIEELALEEANGSLVAILQHFRNFAAHRDRYWQLAATLEDVRVIARGRQPARYGHLKFITTNNKVLEQYWTVLYRGHRCQALLLCRQANAAKTFGRKSFVGFYTFGPTVIARVQQEIDDVLAGRSSALREFERLLAIDQTARQVKVEFDRGQKAAAEALRKLQIAADRYEPEQFVLDLEKSLGRLRRLGRRLPGRVAHADLPTAA